MPARRLASRARRAATGVIAGAVLARAGVIGPIGPRSLVAIGRAGYRFRGGPATMVAASAARWPDRVALVDDGGALTFGALERRADALAAGLAADFGVGAERGVAIMCRNHRGLVEALLAAGRLGADAILVNTELPAPQLSATLSRHRLGLVLHDAEFTHLLSESGLGLPMLVASGEDEAGAEALIAGGGQTSGRVTRPGRLVLLTSGTTGAPKGVPRQPAASEFIGLAASAVHRLGLQSGRPIMVCPPAFHGMGLITLLMGLGTGSTVVLHRRFDAAKVASTIQQQSVAMLVVVPVMLQRLLDVPELASHAGSLTTVLTGASDLTPGLAARFQDTVGDVLFDGYGSSEVGIVTLATPRDLREAPGTVGRPVLGVELRILGDDDAPVRTGEIGRVFIRTPMSFDGYDTGGSKDVVDGFVAADDLGRLDGSGRLWIEGRADDMIVSGGENVFPAPVEDALQQHPLVVEAAVIGVPDEEFGQRLLAFVVPMPGAPLNSEDIKADLRTRLTRYEIPREIRVIDVLPRNATGKVLRKRLGADAGNKPGA